MSLVTPLSFGGRIVLGPKIPAAYLCCFVSDGSSVGSGLEENIPLVLAIASPPNSRPSALVA